MRIPTSFLLICIFYTVAGFSGESMGSVAGKLLRGIPILCGDMLGLCWCLRRESLRLPPPMARAALIALLIFGLGLVMVVVRYAGIGLIYPDYIASDATWTLWLTLNLVLFGIIDVYEPSHLRHLWRIYRIFCILLWLYWFIVLGTGSFQAPPYLVFAFLLSRLSATRALSHKHFIYLLLTCAALGSSALAWSRSVFVGYFCCFCVWLFIQLRTARSSNFCVLIVIFTVAGMALWPYYGERLMRSRLYGTIANREVVRGHSANARLAEVRNAYQTLQENPGSLITGLGHGAVYSLWDKLGGRRNLTEEGYVHNIHIGIGLLGFRYGVLGLCLYLILLATAVRGFFLAVRLHKGREARRKILPQSAERLFLLHYYCFLCLFVHCHFGNRFVDPFFAFSFANTLSFIVQHRSWRRSGRNCVAEVAVTDRSADYAD